MALEQQMPDFPLLSYVHSQTGRTVRSIESGANVATAANQLATARPAKSLRVDPVGDGTWRCAFTRTSRDINLLCLRWYLRGLGGPTSGVDGASVSLVVRDAAGVSVGPLNSRIPIAFQGAYVRVDLTPAGSILGGEGWVDLDALATALTDPDWSFEFTIAHIPGSVAYVDRIEGWEVPRSTVRAGASPDDDAVGALTGPFNPGNPILAGSTTTDGWERLMATRDAAVARCTQYLSLAWICDTAAAIPQTSSGTFATFVNLKETGTTNPVPFTVRILPKYAVAPPGTAAGELGRFRVLYYVSGGGTAQVRLTTGSTTNTYDATGLTGASWQWSPWVDCELPTDASDQVATLTLQGLTSAGTLYLAGVLVEERPA